MVGNPSQQPRADGMASLSNKSSASRAQADSGHGGRGFQAQVITAGRVAVNTLQRRVVAVCSVGLAVVLFISVGKAGGAAEWTDSVPEQIFGLAVPVLLLGVAAYVLVSAPPKDRG